MTANVIVYSDNTSFRHRVIESVGRRPDPALAPIEFREVATHPGLLAAIGAADSDLIVLDAEATPVGGFGVARQLGDEVPSCPPILLMIARSADRWLGAWSRADRVVDAAVPHPELTANVIDLLGAARRRGTP